MCIHEGTRQHDKTAIWLACEARDHGFDLDRVVNRRRDSFHADRRSRGFEGIEKPLRVGCGRRVEQRPTRQAMSIQNSKAAGVSRSPAAREDRMGKKAILFAVVLAVVAMAVEPVGWLFAGRPTRWFHLEAALVIGIAGFAIIGAVCWLITRWRQKLGS